MPFATIKNICSFSSEDSSHPASSLLESESNKKWKTLNSGEKSAYVILQLDSPQLITGIDIGNEHSAFVEILAGRTGNSPIDFQELVLSSSFMTPFESKNSTSINRVRCFGNEKLLPTAKQKWDLIKIICTQPFNKHIQYGLSFIKIHVAKPREQKPISLTANSITKTLKNEKKKIGKFKLRDDEDSGSENSSSLFRRWKESKTPENDRNLSTAAKIRDLSSGSVLKEQSESLKPIILFQKNEDEPKERNEKQDDLTSYDRNRNEIFYTKADEERNDKYEKQISLDQKRVDKERELKNLKKPVQKIENNQNNENDTNDAENFASKDKKEAVEKAKKISDEIIKEVKQAAKKRLSSFKSTSICKKRKKNVIYKPFNKLLEDVVLVISGIQNPDRTDLRIKALAMGARYKADWENGCTHLICAFKNTPKYNQVQKANGKIVKRTWIENCYDSKKRLSWRRFALDFDEENKSDSEDELFDISMKPIESLSIHKTDNLELTSSAKDDKLDQYDLSCSVDYANKNQRLISSGSDTEDELEKARNIQKTKELNVFVSNVIADEEKYDNTLNNERATEILVKESDIYEISTEEEEYTKSQKKFNELNKGNLNYDFFAGKKFYIHPKTTATDKMKLKQYIEDYKGELTGIMSESNYAISGENIKPDSKFSGEVVTPRWIYECNDMECLIPTKRYLPS